MEWISVMDSSQRPEQDGNYLCICNGQPYVLSFTNESGKFYMDFHITKYFEDWTNYVTHYTFITPPKPKV